MSLSKPLALALGLVGLGLGGLLVGYGPVGGDPDLLYRPIKAELARALAVGRLPFWSDRFSLGIPLVAESHAAAFYPPNWLLYRALDVGPAYRVAMWAHHLALVATTYAYGRTLGLGASGAALAGVSMTLSGFSASHSVHEPFYHALPYLPLALVLAERYLAEGGLGRIAAVALTLGAQAVVGHFQIPFWTAGLVVLTGLWRARADRAPWRRAAGLVVAVAWAGAIASVQLALTYDHVRSANFERNYAQLALFPFPPAHWAGLVLPRLFLGLTGPAGVSYWGAQLTTTDEATLHVGSIGLVLAIVGLVARPGSRPLDPWRWLAPIGLGLASMPRWWPDGYWAVQHLPGFGTFRAPGRYTLLTTLGLALLAGRGLDRAIGTRRWRAGLALALAVGLAAIASGLAWSSRPDVRAGLGAAGRLRLIVEGSVCWAVGLVAVVAWRAGRVPPGAVVALAAAELAALFHLGTTPQGWPVRLPEESPAFRAVLARGEVGLVGGAIQNLPVRLGLATSAPDLGINAPPPGYLLVPSGRPVETPASASRLGRFGVSDAIHEGPPPRNRHVEISYLGPDPALDRLIPVRPGLRPDRLWRVEHDPTAARAARVALAARTVKSWPDLFGEISGPGQAEEALFLAAEAPPDPAGPRARSASIVRWDGLDGVVDHDGTCDLVLRRACSPGWTARLDDARDVPIRPADGGLQSIRLDGRGPTRVSVRYRPPLLSVGLAASGTSLGLALLALVAPRRRPDPTNS